MPSDAFFRRSWAAAWWGLGVRADTVLRDQLLARYAEPQRSYHTRQHLHECLAWLPRLAAEAERPAEVALALWFHDAVYQPDQHDNEARSADWARSAVQAAGGGDAAAQRIHALVMATRHAGEPQDADERTLVDIDLAILAAPPARFDAYERQVRQEYAAVPEPAFRAGRRQLLQQFLARPVLYGSATGRQLFEARARANLQRSVERLSGSTG